jgi:FixJ family two-component response regulator
VLQTPLVAYVEDDVSVREAVKGLLTALGFVTEVFASAEDFLESGRLDDASCLITDVQLGGMSGVALQDHLAALGSRIPVIIVTAFPDDGIRAQALAAGAVRFLYKPITQQELVAGIREALDRRTNCKSLQ